MDITPKDKQHIKNVASETLDLFKEVAETAKRELDREHLGPNVLTNVNTLTWEPTMNVIGQINQSQKESYRTLTKEPAIARIVVEDKGGELRIYYICRATPVTVSHNLASYHAPVGRLASMTVGSTFKLPNGTVIEVVEKAKLRPLLRENRWDSRGTVIEADKFGPITIESLLSLLDEIGRTELTENLLEQLLAEEKLNVNIIDGIRRGIITKMGLRDQPILDQYQDEIFRMPLNKRLLILGAPGTGKTTTLIRRLGQKIDTPFLDEDERHIVESVGNVSGVAHAESWMMFTPTELLRQYVQEAFTREGIPASNLQIRTWHDYRRELGRNEFGVLRTATGGTFILKDSIQSLRIDSVDDPISWFSDFNEWQQSIFIEELREAALLLSEKQTIEVQEIGNQLSSILNRLVENSLPSTFESLGDVVIKVKAFVSKIKEDTDAKIKSALNIQMNREKGFIDELARFIDGLQHTHSAEIEEQDDLEAEEEDEVSEPQTVRAAAINVYIQAVRAQARADVFNRTLSKNSRNGKIIEWLGERILNKEERIKIGEKLLIQTSLRRFVNPIKRYIDSIPKRYRSFRRLRKEEHLWYSDNEFDQKELHPLELDVVLLAILRATGDMLSISNIIRDIDTPKWSSLKPILELFRNQVIVDEAPDFSPIQLACMAALAHPRIRSFFACGDFNQRLTTWGTRSTEGLKWVFNDIEIQEITVAYRQSRQLNELARAIIRSAGGMEQRVTLPEHVDSEGVAPVLLESASGFSVVEWLAERILEIERSINQLPSTAIFVNSETEVLPLTEQLNEALAEHNIQVVACSQGRVMGQDNDVRVFDVQHIKGVEFEAVFFIAIDRLTDLQPQLFDKYLYVGTTRAATYLGVTCETILPPAIETLRPLFITNWSIL